MNKLEERVYAGNTEYWVILMHEKSNALLSSIRCVR